MNIVSLAVLFAVVAALLFRDRWYDPRAGANPSALAGLLVPAILLAVLVGSAKSAIVVVPAGHRGVVFNQMQGIKQTALNEGFNIIIPIIETVTLMEVRVQKDTYDSSAASKDLQIVHTKVALNFHPAPEKTPSIFQAVGLDYSEKLIHPAVQEAVKATTARFTAEELITRREDVKTLIKDLVLKQVGGHDIRIDELYITDFDFSRQFAEVVESKQIAEQSALKAKRDLDRIRIEAEQKVASARAEAESLRMQRDAITPQLIQLRQVEMQRIAIEKWNGVLPSVMMGQGGATPLLDIGALTPRRGG